MVLRVRFARRGQTRHLPAMAAAVMLAALAHPAAAQVQLPPQATPSIIGPGTAQPKVLPDLPTRPEGPLIEGEGIEIPAVPGRPGGPTFLLTGIELPQSEFLSDEELRAVTEPWLGRKVGFDDLQRIIEQINALYRAKGVATASAVLPPQRVTEGRVRFDLVEGKLGAVEVAGNRHLGADYIREQIAGESGGLLDGPAMHRRLLRFNLTNDAQVRAALRPGQSFGLTDVVLSVVEPPRSVLDLIADNQGFDTTGRFQGAIFARHNSTLAEGDRLTAYVSRSRGTSTANGSFNLPVGDTGGRVGVGATFSRTKIIKGDFRDLDVEGWSRAFNANGSQPVWTGDQAMVSVIGSVQKSLSVNTINNVTISQMAVTKGALGLSAYWGDDFTSLLATQSVGPAYVDNELDGSGRRVTLWNGSLSATQRLAGPFSLQANGVWQYSPARSLPGDQLFQLGGASTLRGVLPGTLVADSGALGQVEIHWDASVAAPGLDVFAFYDYGFAKPTDSEPLIMSDAGLGLGWRIADRVTAEATWARRLRDLSGAELDRDRVFLRAILHLL